MCSYRIATRLFFLNLKNINYMKKSHSRNYRKIKLKKIQEEKLIKKKKKQKQQFKEEISIKIPVDYSYYKKIAMFYCILVGISLSVLLYPIRSIQPDFILCNVEKLFSSNKNFVTLSNPYFLHTEASRKKLALVKSDLHKQIISIVKNTPMEKMVEEVAKRKRPVAAFLVGIAMKESKFGKFSPKKNGVECYNYWGYRGKENTTDSGYSCFDNPKHAVAVVGDRIEAIVDMGAKTPAQMISWKCGSTCAGHSKESVDKWIQDVAIHYYELNPPKQIAKK